MYKKGIIIIIVLALFQISFVSNFKAAKAQSNFNAKDTVLTEEEIGYRKTSLYEEEGDNLVKTEYNEQYAGEGTLIERSFENAPPLISHNIDDFIPITKDENACLMCHMPEEGSDATPMPKSHFIDYRPKIKIVDGKAVKDVESNEVVQKDLGENLSNAQYNCTQCHVPVANSTVILKNLFDPEFRDTISKNRSNLSTVIGEGVK